MRTLLAGTALLAAALLAAVPAQADERIVSANAAATEIIFALGEGSRLTGVDTASLYPRAALALPKVGYPRTLGAEGVLSLRPTLLFAGPDAGPPEVLQQVAAAGVALVKLPDGYDAAHVRERILLVGKAMGKAPDAEALAVAVGEDFATVEKAVAATASRPKVLFVMSSGRGALQAGGVNTAADAFIRMAGGVNVVSYANYRPLTPEAAVALAPDVILTSTMVTEPLGGPEALLTQPELSVTPAARAKRIVVLDMVYMLGFGPRTPHAVRDFAAALHPEAAIPALPARPWVGAP